METDLLPIGQFARLSRLSVKQLRHYAELGLLQRISPFAATAVPLTTGSGLAAALAVLVVLVAGLTGVGLLGLRRRDLDA